MEGEGSRRASFYAKDIRKQSLRYLYLTFKNKKEKKKKKSELVCMKNQCWSRANRLLETKDLTSVWHAVEKFATLTVIWLS